MLNTTFNSEIKSTKYDGYKMPAVRVPATVKLVPQLPQCRPRVTYKTPINNFLVLSLSLSSITAQKTVKT